jgi:hypothetical protein
MALPKPPGPSLVVLNPFDVSRPYAVVMTIALGMALLPGLGTGLVLVLIAGLRLPVAVPWPQLAQSHGQIQAIGFTLLFIVAVGLQLFPRFLGKPARHAERATWGAATISAALLARWVGQALDPGGVRTVLLLLATVGLPIGVVTAGLAFHGITSGGAATARDAQAWRRFAALAGVSLGTALVVYVWASIDLVLGAFVVAQSIDEALIHLELFGFAACLTFAVASRVFGRFLLLGSHPRFEQRLPFLVLGWGLGLALVSVGWLVLADWGAWLRTLGALIEVATLACWAWWIGLYAAPARASGTPYVTNPTRRWIRFAFAFLASALVINLALYGREAFTGALPSATELSAARHALAQGFLLPLMLAMAVRLLPVLSADALKHRVRLEVTVAVLLVGALIRVAAELFGGYLGDTAPLVSLGGTLGVLGFAVFASDVFSSLRRLPTLRG